MFVRDSFTSAPAEAPVTQATALSPVMVGPVGQDDSVLHVDQAHIVAVVAIQDADDLLPFVVTKTLDEAAYRDLMSSTVPG